jgi:ornithine cyclodeaminase/alanine dehydrogenase-like protein (mu-crystallin family)
VGESGVAVLILDKSAVRQALPMADCIEAMAAVLAALTRGELDMPQRLMFTPAGALTAMAIMPSHRTQPPAYALKAICLVPDNPAQRGLDAHQGAVLVFDGVDGTLRALVEASTLTEIRTAAVSAVATRVLAREDVRTLAILGSGVQARSHLEAMACARSFAGARVWSRTPEHAAAFARELDGRHGFPVEAAPSAEAALEEADVVVTATSSHEPVLRRAWLAPGAHVNAVGAYLPAARELDTATVAEARLYVDRRESALAEAGDVLIPIAEGAIDEGHIRGELGELLTGDVAARTSSGELTVFKSLGVAVEDLAAAELAVGRAREAGIGTLVDL